MLWQDRNGTWHSTVSPIDMKIEQAMIQARFDKEWTEKERSGDWLFDEMFGGWLTPTSTLRLTSKRAILVFRYQTTETNELH